MSEICVDGKICPFCGDRYELPKGYKVDSRYTPRQYGYKIYHDRYASIPHPLYSQCLESLKTQLWNYEQRVLKIEQAMFEMQNKLQEVTRLR